MTDDKNTLYIDSDTPHLVEALTPFIEENISNLTLVDHPSALLYLSLKEGKITLKENCSDRETLIQTPIKMAPLIRQIQKTYATCRPVEIGPYTLDYSARTLTENNRVLHLTEKEADVLTYLDQNRGKGITRDDLLKNVWGYADGIDTHTIETHIYRLRQKIEKNPEEIKILLTRDDGYHLVENR